MSWEDFRSVRKEPMSVECNRRKEWSVGGGGSGAGFIDSLVNTGKWSDGDQWVQETAGASEVSEEVMTRLRVWFLSCVGKWTCWLRLKEERRDRNWEVRVSAGLSRWMLCTAFYFRVSCTLPKKCFGGGHWGHFIASTSCADNPN